MNPFYPQTVFDNSVKSCWSGKCSPNVQQKNNHTHPNTPNTFEPRAFYPHSYINPQAQQQQNHGHQHGRNHNHQTTNQNYQQQNFYSPPNYSHEPRQPYDYNAYVNANSFSHMQEQNPYDRNAYHQGFNQHEQDSSFQNQNYSAHPRPQEPRQRNMFGGLDPQQLMSMITNKNSFAGILGGLGNTNPQLSMLMGLMQNAPKNRRAKNETKAEEIIIDDEKEKKNSPYKSVKDFYNENPQ